MHDAPPPPSSKSSTASDRLSHFLGVGLLLGMALLFSAYLWSARESHAVHPVEIVLRHSPPQGAIPAIEIVPYQHENEPAEPACPNAPAAELCLIIGPRNVTPDSMTFT